MTLALNVLGAATALELLLYLGRLWSVRKILCSLIIIMLAASGARLVALDQVGWSLLVGYLTIYRLVNLLRVVSGRMKEEHLKRAAWRCSRWLIGAQCLAVLLWFVTHYFHNGENYSWWLVGASLQLVATLLLFASTTRHLRTTKPLLLSEAYPDRDLPTLTVAIPARNETEELEACLQTLVGSTYPKLEILVLDDCSQNKRTPEIIRAFAHQGIQFMAGDDPPQNWLAKNFAYEQLSAAANGSLLLFCGVDARFEADSLRIMVETMLSRKKSMISWLPINNVQSGLSMKSLWIQPSRYGWEMALPRRLFQRPAVLSTCWIIERQLLDSAGGFKAVMHSISPESYFAKMASRHNDGYSFLQAIRQTGLRSQKTFSEQRATAIRVRYPQLHRRIELVALTSLFEFAVLVTPFLLFFIALEKQAWLLAILSALNCCLLVAMYALIVRLTYRRFVSRSLWLVGPAALYDIGLLNYSLWKYEFSDVIWKGRNVCLPIMHVISRLPAINK